MTRKLGIFSGSIAALTVLFGLSGVARAAVPNLLTQQGRLFDAAGAPLATPVVMVFSVYATATDTTPLWTETLTVSPIDGYFTVRLGDVVALPAALFDGNLRFLGVRIGTDAEMTPRQVLASVAYAMMANNVTGDITPKSVTVNGLKVIDETGAWKGPLTGLAGTPGPTGPTGATGPAGAVGPTGLQGPQGIQGVAGPAGAQGLQGVAGPTGAQGVQGVAGPVGATGPAGPNWTVGTGLLLTGTTLSLNTGATATFANYSFTSAKSRTVGSSGMLIQVPKLPDTSPQFSKTNEVAYPVVGVGGTCASGSGYLPVSVPYGATLTAARCYFEDSHLTYDFSASVDIRVSDVTATTYRSLGTATLANTSRNSTVSFSAAPTIATAEPISSTETVFFFISMNNYATGTTTCAGGSTSVALRGCTITYSQTTL